MIGSVNMSFGVLGSVRKGSELKGSVREHWGKIGALGNIRDC